MIEIRRPIVARAACALIAMSLPGGANSKDQFRLTSLCEAIVSDNVSRATQLVEQGADVNAKHGCALVAAAQRAQLKMVELLLNRGANPNRHISGDLTVIMGGSTPLVAAVQSRDARVVRLLLERGANPRDDFEAFSIVLNFGDVEMAKLLLHHGANPNMTPPAGGKVYAFVGDQMVTVPPRDLAPDRIDDTAKRLQCRISDLSGATLLQLAVGGGAAFGGRGGREQIAKLLLDKGADPNARTLNGTTPLMTASRPRGSQEVVSMLKAAGADVRAKDRCGRTAEDYAKIFP